MPGDTPDTVGHAELEIGDGLVMIADEFPDHGFLSPKSVGGTPVTIHVYVADADAVFAKALAAWRDRHPRDGGPVLRRPLRAVRGPVGSPLERGQPRRGRVRRGDGAAHGGADAGLSA